MGARKLARWPFWVVGILGFLMLANIYWQLTYVSGIELNTHTWEQRGLSFYRDPITGFQFTAIQHNAPVKNGLWGSIPNPRAQKLATPIATYLRSSTNLPLRWDLVQIEGSLSPGAAASILVELLNAHDRGYDLFWPQWSLDHPQQAAIVWPAAQELVEFGQYAKLPALLELALLENSSSQLKAAVGQLVQAALLEVCQQRSEQGNMFEASAAAKVGLQYGDHPDLRKFGYSSQ